MTNFHALVWDMKCDKLETWRVQLQHFAENQATENHADIAERAAELAKQLGAEESNYHAAATQQREEVTQRLQTLLSNTTKNEAEGCLQLGRDATKTGDFGTGLIELQRGRDLLVLTIGCYICS